MILGLTGGIASGKSTVSKQMKELGAYIIDADEISKQISNKKEVLDKLKKSFGEDIVNSKGLDRKKLRELIFKDNEKRFILNQIMHPEILKEIEDEIRKNNIEKKLIILDIPLLYELKLEYLCDKILVIWVKEEVQINRIQKRDGSSIELAKKILDSQMSLSNKLEKADYSIENNQSIGKLLKKIEKLYRSLVHSI